MPNWRNPEDYVFVEDLEPDQLAWEFLRRNPDYRMHWEDAERQEFSEFLLHTYGSEWYLDTLIDPDDENPERIRWLKITRPAIVTRASRKFLNTSDRTKIALGFDLELSIAQQLEDARLTLLAQREELEQEGQLRPIVLPRRHGDYAQYLRVLDARQQGVEFTEIGEVLFPRSSEFYDRRVEKANELYAQAKRIRDSDFKKLMMRAGL